MMILKNIVFDGVIVWGLLFEMIFKEYFFICGKGGNIDIYSVFFIVIFELVFGVNFFISVINYL